MNDWMSSSLLNESKTQEIIRRFLGKKISFPDCVASLDAYPRLPEFLSFCREAVGQPDLRVPSLKPKNVVQSVSADTNPSAC